MNKKHTYHVILSKIDVAFHSQTDYFLFVEIIWNENDKNERWNICEQEVLITDQTDCKNDNVRYRLWSAESKILNLSNVSTEVSNWNRVWIKGSSLIDL